MVKKEILITNGRNKLSGVYWQVEKPVAIAIIVHGLGEHIGRYEHVAELFSKRGIGVAGFDLPGHGLSEGRRGHIGSMDEFFDCVDSMIEKLDLEAPGVPLILYGHSMGGNIALNYLINRDQDIFSCAVITSPWLTLAIKPSSFQLMLAKTMNKILPGLQQPNGLDVLDISSVAEEQEKYKNDSLNHNKISVRLFNEVFVAGNNAIKNADVIKIPVLIVHGDEDKITSHLGSEAFVKNSSSATLKIWPGLRHETHNEQNKEEVLNYSLTWIADQENDE